MEENIESSTPNPGKVNKREDEDATESDFSASSVSSESKDEASSQDEDVAKNKIFAAISYIWLISIFVLLLKRESEFAKFHAKQGLILALASIVLGWIPIVGWILVLVVFVFEIIGFVKALQGKFYKLPWVSQLAGKINF